MTNYDFKSLLIKNKKPLTNEQVLIEIKNNLDYKKWNNSEYYMLLFRDLNYYTLFKRESDNHETVEEVLSQCLFHLASKGNILGIFKAIADSSALEIWIRTKNDELSCGYFFCYDSGVEKCS